ncbi:MAG: chaperone NapD [Steroidobacteraceae bacterium]|nr:chaperone NapD [Steroidobacteraceae bacterium]
MTQVHVASLIVRTRAENAHDVASRIARAPSTEIHAVENGKIVVVVESTGERALADQMDEIREDADVLMVSLVYHQIDRDETELS